MKSKRNITIAPIIILIIFACWIFWKDFMRGSDFAWIVRQDAYWNAVMEMVIASWLYLIVLTIPFSKNLYRYVSLGLIYLFFSYAHAFFWASIVCAIYALFVYMTGYLAAHIINRSDSKITNDIHYCFVCGIASIIIIVGVFSAFKLGTPFNLRIIFPILFIVEIILLRKPILKVVRMLWKEKLNVPTERLNLLTAGMLALIFTALTIATCRANLGTDYDSLWYGLRSQNVLAPEGGIFDKVTMLACVYTYAKGFEVFSLVFAGLPSYSFTLGCNIMLGVMVLLALYELGRETAVNKNGIFMAMLAVLTPSLLNMTITAKSDVATIYLQVVVLLYVVKSIKAKNGQYLLAAFATLILSFGFKPSSIVFSTLIMILVIGFAIRQRIKIPLKHINVLLIPLGGIVVLFARTMLLTGYPITSIIVDMLKSLGINPKYPYTFPTVRTMSIKELFTSPNFEERFLRLIKIFFAPNTTDIYTLEVSWWGCMFTVIWIVAILSIVFRPIYTLRMMKENSVFSFQVWALLLCSAASGGCMMLLETPDGNYFILLHILTYWYAGTALYNEMHRIQTILIMPLVICNFLLCIAISWSWMVGVTPIDFENHGFYNHNENYIKPRIEENGLSDIYAYLQSEPNQRVIACSQKEEVMFLLPAQLEVFVHHIVWGSNTIENAEAFYEFMQYADVDSIILDEEYKTAYPYCIDLLTELAESGKLKLTMKSDSYTILSVNKDVVEVDKEAVNYLTSINEY